MSTIISFAVSSKAFAMSDHEKISIVLRRTPRPDGTVLVDSGDLPLFSVVGKDPDHAVVLALELLPEYLRVNYPDFVDPEFVDYRPIASLRAKFVSADTQHLAPVCLIAKGAVRGASKNSEVGV